MADINSDQAPRCESCGYNLAGLSELRCPECGRTSSYNVELAYARAKAESETDRKRERWTNSVILAAGVALYCAGVFLIMALPDPGRLAGMRNFLWFRICIGIAVASAAFVFYRYAVDESWQFPLLVCSGSSFALCFCVWYLL